MSEHVVSFFCTHTRDIIGFPPCAIAECGKCQLIKYQISESFLFSCIFFFHCWIMISNIVTRRQRVHKSSHQNRLLFSFFILLFFSYSLSFDEIFFSRHTNLHSRLCCRLFTRLLLVSRIRSRWRINIGVWSSMTTLSWSVNIHESCAVILFRFFSF